MCVNHSFGFVGFCLFGCQILRYLVEGHKKFYEKSDKVATSDVYGPITFYHIVVGDKRVENAAWVYDSDQAGDLKAWIGYREPSFFRQ